MEALKIIDEEIHITIDQFMVDPPLYLKKALGTAFICLTDDKNNPLLLIGDYIGINTLLMYANSRLLDEQKNVGMNSNRTLN